MSRVTRAAQSLACPPPKVRKELPSLTLEAPARASSVRSTLGKPSWRRCGQVRICSNSAAAKEGSHPGSLPAGTNALLKVGCKTGIFLSPWPITPQPRPARAAARAPSASGSSGGRWRREAARSKGVTAPPRRDVELDSETCGTNWATVASRVSWRIDARRNEANPAGPARVLRLSPLP